MITIFIGFGILFLGFNLMIGLLYLLIIKLAIKDETFNEYSDLFKGLIIILTIFMNLIMIICLLLDLNQRGLLFGN